MEQTKPTQEFAAEYPLGQPDEDWAEFSAHVDKLMEIFPSSLWENQPDLLVDALQLTDVDGSSEDWEHLLAFLNEIEIPENPSDQTIDDCEEDRDEGLLLFLNEDEVPVDPFDPWDDAYLDEDISPPTDWMLGADNRQKLSSFDQLIAEVDQLLSWAESSKTAVDPLSLSEGHEDSEGEEDEDGDIVRFSQQRLLAAFDSWYVYRPLLLRIAFDMLRDYDLAKEAVQETWLSAFRAYKYKYWYEQQRELNAVGWLRTIVRNVCRTYYRHEKRLIAVDPIEEEELWNREGDEFQQPDTSLIRRETALELRSLVNELPRSQRVAITLRYLCDEDSDIEKYKYEQIAQILNCPVSTARSHVRRGLRRLRKLIEHRQTTTKLTPSPHNSSKS